MLSGAGLLFAFSTALSALLFNNAYVSINV